MFTLWSEHNGKLNKFPLSGRNLRKVLDTCLGIGWRREFEILTLLKTKISMRSLAVKAILARWESGEAV